MACPLWPLHFLVELVIVWLMCCKFKNIAAGTPEVIDDNNATKWNFTFEPKIVKGLEEENDILVQFNISTPHGTLLQPGESFHIAVEDAQIAQVIPNTSVYIVNTTTDFLSGSFLLRGNFLGYTQVQVKGQGQRLAEAVSEPLTVSVVRPKRIIDSVFIASVTTLMVLNYINMGCTLDVDIIKKTLKRPIAPLVGICSQYLFMPICAFALAYLIFDSSDTTLRLGLFTTGCSPGGGASNMWTYLLLGNLNLSITMTFFSNVLAFVFMPLWIFTLGRVIFHERSIGIPYMHIMVFVFILVIPVGIGLLLQFKVPRIARFCKKILGPFSIFMIIFIVVFGIYANLFMLHIFGWRVAVAGLAVPWLGYIFGALAALAFRFKPEDIIAVSVETGVQNTGIAILLLKLTLPQPDADLTSVVPVAAATMTPWPLLIAMIVLRIMNKKPGAKYKLANSRDDSDEIANGENGSRRNHGIPSSATDDSFLEEGGVYKRNGAEVAVVKK